MFVCTYPIISVLNIFLSSGHAIFVSKIGLIWPLSFFKVNSSLKYDKATSPQGSAT